MVDVMDWYLLERGEWKLLTETEQARLARQGNKAFLPLLVWRWVAACRGGGPCSRPAFR